MVLADHIDDARVELVLHGKVHAILDVSDDDERAHGGRERVVRVIAAFVLVFDEVVGLRKLADIM